MHPRRHIHHHRSLLFRRVRLPLLLLTHLTNRLPFPSFFSLLFPAFIIPLATSFVGAITKRPRAVRVFARVIAWLLGIQLITSTLYILAIFLEPKSDFIKACENGSANLNVADECTNHIALAKGVFVGVIVVALLLHACEFPFSSHPLLPAFSSLSPDKHGAHSALPVDELYVVSAYAAELERTELNRGIILNNPKFEDTRPLTGPDTSYPYADKAHSGGGYA